MHIVKHRKHLNITIGIKIVAMVTFLYIIVARYEDAE